MLLRSLIIEQPEPYMKLFMSMIIPALTYGSEVWHPQFSKDLHILQRVVDKYFGRVEFRCHLSHRSLDRPNIKDIIVKKDLKTLESIIVNGRLDVIFNTVPDRTEGTKIFPKSTAISHRGGAQVASFYAWRVASVLGYHIK
jgi:hypothetical protein